MSNMKNVFTNESYTCLLKAGWNSERSLNKEEIIEKLSIEGYSVFKEVVDFLASFEGIEVNFFNKKSKKIDDFNFCLERAFNLEVPERLMEDYLPRIQKQKICPIGTAYRDHFILIMDDNGIVYGAYDDFLVKIGNSYFEAINAIISDQEFIKIP